MLVYNTSHLYKLVISQESVEQADLMYNIFQIQQSRFLLMLIISLCGAQFVLRR